MFDSTVQCEVEQDRQTAYNVTVRRVRLLTQYCAGDKIEKIEVGWACDACG